MFLDKIYLGKYFNKYLFIVDVVIMKIVYFLIYICNKVWFYVKK